ncbi:Demethylrebeccamycin-D-glucose O-methyltransferase [Mucisphaera calidilacus]|uniref:Demethylrebeccamycin-D-glucose O-methyltransferase n=2 Tax=Mucisphaera calidilacus TaxID=2527982 RepID=A0A518C018_9BACT|nr:Demethylrebeccamycin-D-glucose O-methyltransferase [Mucisphaera calidilacus]
MDRMYRYTRHVYDTTRKFYLLGRDRLLRELDTRPDDSVVEIGCGTARNLIRLARIRPDVRLFGLDASDQMLETARQHIHAAGLDDRITVRQGLAENINHRDFGLDQPFDVPFFSYSLSMIPTWKESVDTALDQLAPGRTLYAVDFWDQADLPAPFRWTLTHWLKLFHVVHRPELIEYLQHLGDGDRFDLDVTSIMGRYAYIARLSPTP